MNIIVTVADSHRGSLDVLVEALRARGMRVDSVLAGVGIITGSLPSGNRHDLASIVGVASVDGDGPQRLPPPDRGVQ